jgi:hypothetical protein
MCSFCVLERIDLNESKYFWQDYNPDTGKYTQDVARMERPKQAYISRNPGTYKSFTKLLLRCIAIIDIPVTFQQTIFHIPVKRGIWPILHMINPTVFNRIVVYVINMSV